MILSNAPHFSNYIGIPYGGPDSNDAHALNCWELVEKIMIEAFRKNPPRYEFTGDYKKVYPVFLMELSAWQSIPFEQRQAGDVVLLNMAGYPIHLGILVNRSVMIHTLKNYGSCAENITTTRWRSRVVSVHRWPNE